MCRWYHSINSLTQDELKLLPPGQGLLQPRQAPLTQMDRWILSRLSAAVEATNTGFSEYNFPQVILFSDWLVDAK